MKSFSQIVKETVNKPISPEEQNFIDQHGKEVKDYPVDQKKSETPSKKKRLADKDADQSENDYDQAYVKEDSELEEAYQKSAGFYAVDKQINSLEKYLSKNSALAKSIAKSMGSGYLKDFEEMGKHFDKVIAIWDQISHDVDMSESVEVEQSEELSEDVIADLQKIVKKKSAGEVKLADGSKMKVDMFTASAMTKVHDALNDANKKKFSDAINKNETMFMKMMDFAFSKVKK